LKASLTHIISRANPTYYQAYRERTIFVWSIIEIRQRRNSNKTKIAMLQDKPHIKATQSIYHTKLVRG